MCNNIEKFVFQSYAPATFKIWLVPCMFFSSYFDLINLIFFYLAIIQQRHTEEDFFKCYEDFLAEMRFKNNFQVEKQFRVIEFTHQQSYGPNFARSFTHQLLQDEEFCLQLDSHSDVVQNWDVELTDMWGLTENEMAILSTQPVDISMLGLNDNAVPHLCQAKIDERYFLIF